jgi:hypothetical protein
MLYVRCYDEHKTFIIFIHVKIILNKNYFTYTFETCKAVIFFRANAYTPNNTAE